MATTGTALLIGAGRPRLAAAGVLPKGKTAEQAERCLLETIEDAHPDVVAIDAPLTLPPCLSCPSFCRGPAADLCELEAARQVWDAGGHPVTERLCEVQLRAELDSGPLPTMRIAQIAARGVALARRVLAGGTSLGAPGVTAVIEVYPYATLSRLADGDKRLSPRKPGEADLEFRDRIIEGLSKDIAGLDEEREALVSGHAIDALVAAYTGWLHPDGLEAPPADHNIASGWIWAPPVPTAAGGSDVV